MCNRAEYTAALISGVVDSILDEKGFVYQVSRSTYRCNFVIPELINLIFIIRRKKQLEIILKQESISYPISEWTSKRYWVDGPVQFELAANSIAEILLHDSFKTQWEVRLKCLIIVLNFENQLRFSHL